MRLKSMNRRTALMRVLGFGAAFGIAGLAGKRRILTALSLSNEIEPSEREAMANVAENFRRKFAVPGLSIAIAQNGRLAYEQAFGVTGRDSREELTPSHLFRIASVTKPITSATILSLIEKGRLRSDDRVFGKGGILGADYGRQPYGPNVEQITIDHLLTHTSGGWDNGPDDPMFSNVGMSQAELISWTLNNQPLKNPPGKVYAYSNFGYCLLGRVIEKITGQSYSDYVQRTILSPCGITDMRIAGNTLEERAPREVTYYGQDSGPYQNPYEINVRRMDSHGGWIATAADLVHFATHVDGFDRGRNILKAETIRKMATPSDANPNYARGWSVNTKGHWWHGGSLPGTTTVLVRTSTRFCWAALTNTRREGTDNALDDMVWEMISKVTAWRSAQAPDVFPFGKERSISAYASLL
jgi:CubicO group peptidase (beta-lactamase class C family)